MTLVRAVGVAGIVPAALTLIHLGWVFWGLLVSFGLLMASTETLGDTTTLADPTVVDDLVANRQDVHQ